MGAPNPSALISKIAGLLGFSQFRKSRQQDRSLLRAAAAASTPTFAIVWKNPEDDIYDTL